MGNSWFQFQQFRVNQDRCAMKISTDAVLLGTMAEAENPLKILDIGTGTGVLAMMLAQRFVDAQITAIEIDTDAANQAKENFLESKFSERLELIQIRLQDFSSVEKYDLIVSNPPFFPDHLKSQDPKRNQALHTDELSFEDLIGNVSTLLGKEGSFWVILPPRQMKILENLAEKAGLFITSKTSVKDNEGKPIHREICEFSFQSGVKNEVGLVIKDTNSNYSDPYKRLLTGFLLNF
jgi:tRNA1Val (adenine37-N6)-methyltransferase